MPVEPYLKTLELTDVDWSRFETTPTPLDGTFQIASNIASANIKIRIDDGTSHTVQRNGIFVVKHFDISRLQFQGNAAAGDRVTFVGHSPAV